MGALSGRVALVTGASRGIGAAMASALAGHGAEVFAVSRSPGNPAVDAAHSFGSGARIRPVRLDVTDPKALTRLAGSIRDQHGRLDILVGNAGVLHERRRTELFSPEEWHEVIAVNLTANWYLIREMHPLLAASDAGRALFVTSGLSWRGQPKAGPYAASKAGLNALVEAYAAENEGSSLRVNLFSPGPTKTKLYADAFPDADLAGVPTPDEVAEKMVEACMPWTTYNGKVYEFRDARWTALQPPKPV
ncbi:SDR family NAD(P)-dependent oxidoreductase [Faunimonas sp. B44]|uniref:SDR family NAD(P)-dependent oxidoreductase n=1 Tax=Faunimonas sp. B44 TaxID=3461493 RepID=UPI004044D8CA